MVKGVLMGCGLHGYTLIPFLTESNTAGCQIQTLSLLYIYIYMCVSVGMYVHIYVCMYASMYEYMSNIYFSNTMARRPLLTSCISCKQMLVSAL